MLPLALLRKKLRSRFIKSFLFYVPYAVLAVMTVPAIFESTGSVFSAAVGFAAAVLLAYRGAALLPVSPMCGDMTFTAMTAHWIPTSSFFGKAWDHIAGLL